MNQTNEMNQANRAQRLNAAYEAHRRAQLAFAAELPLWDKLRWLEQMHRLALRLQGQDIIQEENRSSQ